MRCGAKPTRHGMNCVLLTLVVRQGGRRRERRHADGLGGPTGVPRLVSAEKQQGHAARIEGEEDAIWASVMLDAEFLHVGKLRTRESANMRAAKSGATLYEQQHRTVDAVPLFPH